MLKNSFARSCKKTINPINTIFNREHAGVHHDNISKFGDDTIIFTRVRARTDRRTYRQTNRSHKHFSTLLESVKKGKEINTYFEALP